MSDGRSGTTPPGRPVPVESLLDEDDYAVLAMEEDRTVENNLWIEVSSEHRHASPRPWCLICARIKQAREELTAE